MSRTVNARVCVVVMALGGMVAACGGGTSDGWVSVGTGDTYGEWELFAEANEGDWTGCLRFPDDEANEECGDPSDDLVVFEEESDGAQYGAVRDGVELEFTDSGDAVELIDADGIDGHRFFVVADTEVQISG